MSIVLDARFNVKAFHLVAIGTLSQVLFEPREILRPAVAVSRARIVAMHNHPSGDPGLLMRIWRLPGGWLEPGRLWGFLFWITS